MQPRLHLLLIVGSIGVFLIILELIRRGKLREEFSLVWLLSSGIVFLLVVFRGSLGVLADFVQVDYAPSLIFLVAIALLMIIQILQATTVSKLTTQNRDLAQKLAILELHILNQNDNSLSGDFLGFNRISHEFLRNFSHELGLQETLPAMLNISLQKIIGGFGADSGSMIVVDDSGHLLESATIFGGNLISKNSEDLNETVSNGLAGWVMEHREPVLVNNTIRDNRWLKRSWETMNGISRSAICVPLQTEDTIFGVLTVVQDREGKFSNDDLISLMALATIITFAGKEFLNYKTQVVFSDGINRSNSGE